MTETLTQPSSRDETKPSEDVSTIENAQTKVPTEYEIYMQKVIGGKIIGSFAGNPRDRVQASIFASVGDPRANQEQAFTD